MPVSCALEQAPYPSPPVPPSSLLPCVFFPRAPASDRNVFKALLLLGMKNLVYPAQFSSVKIFSIPSSTLAPVFPKHVAPTLLHSQASGFVLPETPGCGQPL